MDFDFFKFESGDGSKWLIASRDAVIGENYANQEREIVKSSLFDAPSSA